jgi:hypothetical protein
VHHRCRYQWTESLGKSQWDRTPRHQLQECKRGHISYQFQKMPNAVIHRLIRAVATFVALNVPGERTAELR